MSPQVVEMMGDNVGPFAGPIIEDAPDVVEGEPRFAGSANEVDATDRSTVETSLAAHPSRGLHKAPLLVVTNRRDRYTRGLGQLSNCKRPCGVHSKGIPATREIRGSASGLSEVTSTVALSLAAVTTMSRNAQHDDSRAARSSSAASRSIGMCIRTPFGSGSMPRLCCSSSVHSNA